MMKENKQWKWWWTW